MQSVIQQGRGGGRGGGQDVRPVAEPFLGREGAGTGPSGGDFGDRVWSGLDCSGFDVFPLPASLPSPLAPSPRPRKHQIVNYSRSWCAVQSTLDRTEPKH